MLDVSEIVAQTIAEAQALGSTDETGTEPDSSPDVRLDAMLAKASLPERAVLEKVLVELFWASTLAEEGRSSLPRLLYLQVPPEGRPIHWLDAPVALTREALRKLSPAHGPRGYLCWADDGGRPMITGVEPRFGSHPENLILSAPAAAAIDVLWLSARILTVRNGATRALSTCELPSLRNALDELGEAFHDVIEPKHLGSTVQALVDSGHGGALWIASGKGELRAVACRRIRVDERALLDWDVEARETWLLSIGHLAAVDGAVVIDCNLNVLGFGAFTDAKTSRVRQRRIGGGQMRSSHRNSEAGAIAPQ